MIHRELCCLLALLHKQISQLPVSPATYVRGRRNCKDGGNNGAFIMLPVSNQLCSFATRVNTDKELGRASWGLLFSAVSNLTACAS